MCIRVCACTRVRMSVQAVHDFYATQRRDRSWLRRECRCEGTVEAGGLVSLGCISVLLAEYAETVNDMFSEMTITTTKQIDHKAYIPAELSRFDRYPQLFLSFPSLFPLSVSHLVLLASCEIAQPASQRETSGIHWACETREKGQLEAIRTQEISRSVQCVWDLTCPERWVHPIQDWCEGKNEGQWLKCWEINLLKVYFEVLGFCWLHQGFFWGGFFADFSMTGVEYLLVITQSGTLVLLHFIEFQKAFVKRYIDFFFNIVFTF